MTPSSALPSNRRRWLPHWVPMLFIGGFLVVIGVNGALIYFAEDTFSGLETASPYERGLDYNKTLDADAAQKKLGWQYQAAISGSGTTRTLEVRLADRDGRALDRLAIAAYLVRPSNDGLDVTLAPQATGDGRYTATFVLPAAGQWDLRVVARDDTHTWQHSERVFVK